MSSHARDDSLDEEEANAHTTIPCLWPGFGVCRCHVDQWLSGDAYTSSCGAGNEYVCAHIDASAPYGNIHTYPTDCYANAIAADGDTYGNAHSSDADAGTTYGDTNTYSAAERRELRCLSYGSGQAGGAGGRQDGQVGRNGR